MYTARLWDKPHSQPPGISVPLKKQFLRNCLNLLRNFFIIVLSVILRFFLAVSAKFQRSKPIGFSLLNSRNHLKNYSQNSSKINLNCFLEYYGFNLDFIKSFRSVSFERLKRLRRR